MAYHIYWWNQHGAHIAFRLIPMLLIRISIQQSESIPSASVLVTMLLILLSIDIGD